MVRVRIRFSDWLASCYAHVFVLLEVAIVSVLGFLYTSHLLFCVSILSFVATYFFQLGVFVNTCSRKYMYLRYIIKLLKMSMRGMGVHVLS